MNWKNYLIKTKGYNFSYITKSKKYFNNEHRCAILIDNNVKYNTIAY